MGWAYYVLDSSNGRPVHWSITVGTHHEKVVRRVETEVSPELFAEGAVAIATTITSPWASPLPALTLPAMSRQLSGPALEMRYVDAQQRRSDPASRLMRMGPLIRPRLTVSPMTQS